MRHAALIVSLLLLSGCATPLHKLKEINPNANDFNSSLASEYLAYADSESEQGRKLTAQRYADKGLKALKNETVLPQEADKSLTDEQQKELAAARIKLIALLNDDMKRVTPQKLAHAQLLFDCWQYQLSKDLNQEKAPCADEFASTLTELQEVSDSFTYTMKSTHAVTFARSSAKLNASDKATLKAVADSMKESDLVEIEGHATSGAPGEKLSAQRLAAIKAVLIEAGVVEQHIRVKAQHDGAAVYLGGEKPKANRARVTITVKTYSGDKTS